MRRLITTVTLSILVFSINVVAVSNGSTSTDDWWNVPYPDTFDTSQLANEQGFIIEFMQA